MCHPTADAARMKEAACLPVELMVTTVFGGITRATWAAAAVPGREGFEVDVSALFLQMSGTTESKKDSAKARAAG